MKNSKKVNKTIPDKIIKLEEDKQNLEWHRTFNNESTQWSYRLSIMTLGFLGLGILYAGIILWLLKTM